jgi:hypothetical protein
MTRKDFELIASVIAGLRRDCDEPTELHVLNTVAQRFATQLATTNAGFNRMRFLKACGMAVGR